MSDAQQGPGWWLASDSKWYPPESAPAGLVSGGPFAHPSEPQPGSGRSATYCRECGSELGVAKFCGGCGQQVAGGGVAEPRAIATETAFAELASPHHAASSPERRVARWIRTSAFLLNVGFMSWLVSQKFWDAPEADKCLKARSRGACEAMNSVRWGSRGLVVAVALLIVVDIILLSLWLLFRPQRSIARPGRT